MPSDNRIKRWSDIDWEKILLPDTPFLEIFIRGSLVYLSLFCLLRFILKRQSSTLGITDMLVIVLIADASQNAMAGSYQSVPDGILLVATIIFWSFILDWLDYHFPFLRRFMHPPPLKLIHNGKLLLHNMRQELITREELLSQLREQGISSIVEVKEASIEGDGKISITPYGDNYKVTR